MHLSPQTIKVYSNLLSFSEPLKKAHRILTCGTAENKERFETKRYFMHKFKMLGTNGCFVSFIIFITDTIKRPTTKSFIAMVKRNSKRTQETWLCSIFMVILTECIILRFHKLSAQNHTVQIQSYYD